MTPADLRRARAALHLTQEQAAVLMETDKTTVQKWERDAGLPSHRPAPARVARLYQAMLDGWRPKDWPQRVPALEELEDLV